MHDVLLLLALAAFLTAAVWAAIHRSAPMAFLATGLIFLTLDAAGWIHA